MKKINCLRCGVPMKHLFNQRIQLGGASWLLPDLNNIMSGYLPVMILVCPKCRKLEFFLLSEKQRNKHE
ncbi:hypothetical protein SAMN02910447_00522 [Ruminococcus sp. YE71]|uniref:hypothetical protein n=1 Tax=unclassified Ruminococcus TaxID=2608920 RepID=UPI00088B9B70|nr:MULTISPECIES: hypothetical protein [unclassified Ruminococcus]SDA12026.1 hypothetical protein SAMN02910446_00521 [Ruminococcus sp. YE78]SFW16118.1 hypothetical protein SAMN02910447_00522 [Ruminococcus sp. YE71]